MIQIIQSILIFIFGEIDLGETGGIVPVETEQSKSVENKQGDK